MAIVINGSGTVTGLSVGGLPDGTVDADTLASGAGGVDGVVSAANATAITIDSNENVGIGITSPLDILHLNDPDDDCVINLDTAQANKNSIIKFSDPDAQGRGFIQYNHTTDSLRTTVAGTERTRIHSNGVLTVPAGIALGVAATSNNGDNTLDDYEEGYWNPTLTCSTSGSFGLDSGADTLAYTKVGRVVHVQGAINAESESSPNGYLRITLPFQPFTGTDDSDYCEGSATLYNHGGSKPNGIKIFVYGDTHAYFRSIPDNGVGFYLDQGDVDTSFQIRICFSYITAA
jgi:hypothetical protein